MATGCHGALWQCLRHGASVLGIVSLSVLTTLGVQRLLAPPRAIAQSSQAQEIRASAFVLVGADGTVLARLAPAAAGGGGLAVYDAGGKPRASLSSDPAEGSNGFYGVAVFDDQVRPRAVLAYNSDTDGGGVFAFGPTGAARIGMQYNAQVDAAGLVFRDAKQIRARAGALLPGSGGAFNYGFQVLDSQGQPVATLP